jgi:hypothetical protein
MTRLSSIDEYVIAWFSGNLTKVFRLYNFHTIKCDGKMKYEKEHVWMDSGVFYFQVCLCIRLEILRKITKELSLDSYPSGKH